MCKFVLTRKNFFSATVVFSYLLLGSGRYVPSTSGHDARREAQAFAATIPRRVYRYSVVPGGVYSPEELLMARRTDPVVALHFADFGSDTHLERLKEDMYVYISYRKGDKVYYSKKKHKVCKGEMVITDGKNYARTRCANRLSKVFRPPAVAYDEPTAPQFDYIEPPTPPETTPTDPLLTSNYLRATRGSGIHSAADDDGCESRADPSLRRHYKPADPAATSSVCGQFAGTVAAHYWSHNAAAPIVLPFLSRRNGCSCRGYRPLALRVSPEAPRPKVPTVTPVSRTSPQHITNTARLGRRG